MGAYDGYKYAKQKKLKGWKMGAAVVGGALLGVVNPFKVFKVAKTGYKAYKVSKYASKARRVYKGSKAAKAKPKLTVVVKKKVKTVSKPSAVKKKMQTVQKQVKQAKAACFTAGTKIYTEKGFRSSFQPNQRFGKALHEAFHQSRALGIGLQGY